MKIRIGVLFCAIIFCQASFGGVEVGAGLSSGMSGRFIPGINLAYLGSDWALSGTSIGVQTTTYYISDYTLCFNRTWNMGKFFWGDLHAGFGGGVGYSQRGYRASSNSDYDTRKEFLIGPSFRVTWLILDPVVFTFDGLYGFGTATLNVAPLFHDLVMFSLGFQL